LRGHLCDSTAFLSALPLHVLHFQRPRLYSEARGASSVQRYYKFRLHWLVMRQPGSGRPATAITSQNVARVEELIFVKMICASSKINAISFHKCKLPINKQNSIQKDSPQAKISWKVVEGVLF